VESLLGSEWFCLYGFVNEEKQNKTNEICREWLGFDVMDPKNSSYKQQQQEEEEEEEEEEKKKNIKQEEEQEVYYQDDFEEETNINL
jgi:hypothetical protein